MFFQSPQVRFPGPTWWPTTPCKSSSWGSGDPMPSCDLCGHCVYVVHRYTQAKHPNAFFLKKRNSLSTSPGSTIYQVLETRLLMNQEAILHHNNPTIHQQGLQTMPPWRSGGDRGDDLMPTGLLFLGYSMLMLHPHPCVIKG